VRPGILRLLFVCIGLILPLCAGAADRLEVPEVARDKVICFAPYTVHNNILKMTAQLYPLKPDEDKVVLLEIRQDGRWKQIGRAKVIEDGWTAPFRVENWDTTKDIEYRLAHGKKAYYTGTIRKDPLDKETIVVVAFTGNSISAQHGGDIPKTDIVENVKKVRQRFRGHYSRHPDGYNSRRP
jgi:hypothetical protein